MIALCENINYGIHDCLFISKVMPVGWPKAAVGFMAPAVGFMATPIGFEKV